MVHGLNAYAKKKLGLISAVASNGVIGNKGSLPEWNIPGDLKRFRQLTERKSVIMGRKTWESLPDSNRPLKGRKNIVLSRRWSGFNLEVEVGIVKSSFYWALEEGFKENDEAYVIGGAELYGVAIHFADFLDLTEVNGNYNGDTYFPQFNKNDWTRNEISGGENFKFVRYIRK